MFVPEFVCFDCGKAEKKGTYKSSSGNVLHDDIYVNQSECIYGESEKVVNIFIVIDCLLSVFKGLPGRDFSWHGLKI